VGFPLFQAEERERKAKRGESTQFGGQK